MLYRCRTIAAVLDAARPSIADQFMDQREVSQLLLIETTLYAFPIISKEKFATSFLLHSYAEVNLTCRHLASALWQTRKSLILAPVLQPFLELLLNKIKGRCPCIRTGKSSLFSPPSLLP